MPTPTVPFAAFDAWLSTLAIAQPDVTAAAPPAGGAQPVLPGMPSDAASAPNTTTGAQTPGQAPPTGTRPPPAAGLGDFMPLLLVGMLVLIVLTTMSSSRAAKREKKKHDELMASLRRNDKVQTIGGMIGTVVELKDDEVVIQGENPGSKFRFARSAVQQVIRPPGASSDSGSATPEIEVKGAKEGSKV